MAPLIPILSASSFSDSTMTNSVGIEATKGKMMTAPTYPDTTSKNQRSQSDPALPTTNGSFDECDLSPKPFKRRISFNERVSVREYRSNSWVNVKDMEQLSPVLAGGRKVITIPKEIAFPSDYQDYCCDSSTTTTMSSSVSCSVNDSMMSPQHVNMLHREIRNVLIVDKHDIFLKLFSKRWQEALPHVNVMTAHSSDEALQLMNNNSNNNNNKQQQPITFDIVIVEERLSLFHRQHAANKLTSGSALIAHLKQLPQFQHSLLIGVSAHWQSDHATMVQSGADYCWTKAPPPTLRNNRALLEELLHTLLLKRGKHQMAQELMVASASSGVEPEGAEKQ